MKTTITQPFDIVELPWFNDARLMLEAGASRMLLLIGEPGTGKTTFAHHFARQATGQPPQVVCGNPQAESEQLFGRWTDSGSRFIDGPLTAALKSGGWLLIEDLSQMPLACRLALLPLRDQRELVNPCNNESVPVPPAFRLVATSNADALVDGGGAHVLYDGFHVLQTPPLTADQVRRFLHHHFPDASVRQVERTLELWHTYRGLTGSGRGSEGKRYLSFRAACQLLSLLEAGMPEARAVQLALVNKFLPTDANLFSAAVWTTRSERDPDSGKDDHGRCWNILARTG